MSRVFGEPREHKEIRCPKCGGATAVSTVGSITQWLSACSCNLVEDPSSEASGPVIHMCSTCGKRISAGRSGSLTQCLSAFVTIIASIGVPKFRFCVPYVGGIEIAALCGWKPS